ncbi:MAG: hypothetical protein F6K42_19565 [Leptolyngbya sp. SIO1D8]|nr:hypothetical protein [Leptolyngbya sp. SIO1D8]
MARSTPPTPTKPTPIKRPSNNLNGCLQAFIGLLLLLGTVGLVWWIASRWDPNGGVSTTDPGSIDNQEAVDQSDSPTFSREEQARKNALRQRRENLRVDNRFLVRLTDQLFYGQFPEREGIPLSDRPEDDNMRAEWDSIAAEVLDVLEAHLSPKARQQLGNYTAEDRDQWRQQVNQRNVGSRALYDLADAKFTYLYPQNATQNFIEQPIGQIWHGLADDRVKAILANERLQEIQFEQGRFSQSLRDRLEPGEGRIYIINLSEGQLMRLNLQASEQSTRLSLYVPNPTDETPYLLEDSIERTWSGQLPQSGYYEIVVVSAQNVSLDYALDVGADNISSSPTEPPATPPTEPEELPRDRN